MTVNELIEEFKKLQEAERGEQEVFYFTSLKMSISEVLPDDDVIILL